MTDQQTTNRLTAEGRWTAAGVMRSHAEYPSAAPTRSRPPQSPGQFPTHRLESCSEAA